LSGTHKLTIFFVGLICGATAGGLVLIAVIAIIACKMRLDLKFYLMYGYRIHMALNLSKYKQLNK